MRVQVVLVLANGVASLTMSEREAVASTFTTGARGLHCTVASCRFGDRWVEVVLDAEPNFFLPGAMTSLKSVASRMIRSRRGSRSGIWSGGYAAVTLGSPVDPAKAAAELPLNRVQDDD